MSADSARGLTDGLALVGGKQLRQCTRVICGTAMILSVVQGNPNIRVDLASQRLELVSGGQVLERFPVSTSKYGPCEISGSLKTPRGQHIIRAKIGSGQPLGTVFRGRRSTGELYSDELALSEPDQDWILTRILWLSGLEKGKNLGTGVDSKSRYIYIHGTAEEGLIGKPASDGCVRMYNSDVISLFDRVDVNTEVWII